MTSPERITPHAWRVLAVSAAGVYVVFLDATIVNIAFPAISADFSSVTRAGLSWVLNAYAVVFGALLVTAGRLADARGRKRSFLTGLVVFAAASAVCGIAPDVQLLVAARAVQAIGGALLVPASLALLLPEFPLAKRATAVGLWGAVGAVAAATGPSIGALLVEGPGWRWVFYVNVPFCLAAFLFGRRVLRESTAGTTSTPDVPGIVLVTAIFGLLSLGTVQGEQWGWGSGRIVGAYVLAAVLLPLLVLRSLKHPDPALPVGLFRVRAFSVATTGTLLFGLAFYGQILCNVLFLSGVWHYSLLRTAVSVLPSPLLAAVVAPVAGRMADRFGYLAVVVPGAAFFALGSATFAVLTTAAPHYAAHFLPGSALCGIGIGMTFSTLGAAGSQALAPPQFGVGSAMGAAGRQLGAVLGVALFVAVLGTPGPATVVAAFHHCWVLFAVVAALCSVVCLGLRPRRTATTSMAVRPAASPLAS